MLVNSPLRPRLVAFFFLGSTGFGVVAERHVVVSPLKLKKQAARGDIPFACAGNRSPLLVSVSSAAAIDVRLRISLTTG